MLGLAPITIIWLFWKSPYIGPCAHHSRDRRRSLLYCRRCMLRVAQAESVPEVVRVPRALPFGYHWRLCVPCDRTVHGGAAHARAHVTVRMQQFGCRDSCVPVAVSLYAMSADYSSLQIRFRQRGNLRLWRSGRRLRIGPRHEIPRHALLDKPEDEQRKQRPSPDRVVRGETAEYDAEEQRADCVERNALAPVSDHASRWSCGCSGNRASGHGDARESTPRTAGTRGPR